MSKQLSKKPNQPTPMYGMGPTAILIDMFDVMADSVQQKLNPPKLPQPKPVKKPVPKRKPIQTKGRVSTVNPATPASLSPLQLPPIGGRRI